MNLYDATHEVHHDAENTEFGKLIKAGKITPQQYADWLFVQYTVHTVIDDYLPAPARRLPQLYLDMADLKDVEFRGSEALVELMKPAYEGGLVTHYLGGLCYVFTGAHLRGGPQNRKSLEAIGLPCRHLRFDKDDALKTDEYLKSLRDMVQFAEPAKQVFRNVIKIMDGLCHV